jgi:hypothetical protein
MKFTYTLQFGLKLWARMLAGQLDTDWRAGCATGRQIGGFNQEAATSSTSVM